MRWRKNYSGVISSVVADIAAKLNITNFPGSISALVAVQTSSAGLMIYANVSVSALVAGNVVRSADVTSPSVMSQNVSDGLSVLPLPRLAGVYSSSTSATDTIALAEPAAVSALTAAVVVPQPPNNELNSCTSWCNNKRSDAHHHHQRLLPSLW